MSALLHDLLTRLDHWHTTLQAWGWLGVFGYALALVVLQMGFIPLAIFGVAAGAIFGFWKGVIAITIGTNIGAVINFLLSRYVARGAVSRYLSHHEKFRLIDAAIGREGGKIIALLRLCPMPFGLANYAYGLTAIPFWPYFLATFLAIIPANCFFVWLGASAQEGLAAASGAGRPRHPGEYVLMGVGLVAAFCALNYIARVAKAAVSKGASAADEAPAA
ncbi:MAG TPA: VTT domain-containing protein [Chthoniobacter sp.]|nr:VTT domain-containing protein [Chthoniobacter sp.]